MGREAREAFDGWAHVTVHLRAQVNNKGSHRAGFQDLSEQRIVPERINKLGGKVFGSEGLGLYQLLPFTVQLGTG